MSCKITKVDEKTTPSKTVVKLKNVLLSHLKFVDEDNGDFTNEVLAALPDDIKTVSFSIVVEDTIED